MESGIKYENGTVGVVGACGRMDQTWVVKNMFQSKPGGKAVP
jgi:hypothetical protein